MQIQSKIKTMSLSIQCWSQICKLYAKLERYGDWEVGEWKFCETSLILVSRVFHTDWLA